MVSVKPPAKIFGGKYYLKDKILGLFPPRSSYHTYVEAYGGMGNVLLAHDPTNKSEVFNDLDGDVSNFFSVLQSQVQFDQFKHLAALAPFSEKQFKRSLAALASHKKNPLVPADAAYHFFVVARQSRAGNREDFATCTKTRLRRRMNEQVSAWLSGVENLYDVHQRLQRVLIRNVPATALLIEFDNAETVHYLDPPYLPSTRVAATEYHDFEMSEDDHVKLLDVIKKSRSKILLSGYHSSLYDTELKSWKHQEFSLPNNVSGAKVKRRMVEVCWYNF